MSEVSFAVVFDGAVLTFWGPEESSSRAKGIVERWLGEGISGLVLPAGWSGRTHELVALRVAPPVDTAEMAPADAEWEGKLRGMLHDFYWNRGLERFLKHHQQIVAFVRQRVQEIRQQAWDERAEVLQAEAKWEHLLERLHESERLLLETQSLLNGYLSRHEDLSGSYSYQQFQNWLQEFGRYELETFAQGEQGGSPTEDVAAAPDAPDGADDAPVEDAPAAPTCADCHWYLPGVACSGDNAVCADFRSTASVDDVLSGTPPAAQQPPQWRYGGWDTLAAAAQDIMRTFVDRCDRGEIRSKRTYAQCKEWLSAYGLLDRHDTPAPAPEPKP